MAKYFYFLFITLSVLTNLFSQEINIPAEFSQDGKLYENRNDSSVVLVQFEANEECFVIGYLGKDQYKIKYKDYIGFVDSQYLVFNDEIDDFFYEFQDNESLKTIKQEQLRRQKIQEIVNTGEEERNESIKEDSLAKASEEEEKRITLDQEALSRKLDTVRVGRIKQDSIVKVRAEEEKQKALKQEVLERKLEAERIEQIKQESIVNIRVEEEKQKAYEEETLARKLDAERMERTIQDSIAKVVEEEKQKALEQETLAIKQDVERIELLKKDSIAQLKEAEKEIIENKVMINSAIEDEKKEQARLENIKFRNTCHYAMNEFDTIDKIKIIRTNPYNLTKNLTVELFKRGRSTNVFFNLMEDLGCSSYLPGNRSYVKVRLENNQTITFYHSWDMDCGDFRFKGVISKSQMALLQNSPIKSIFLKGTKYSSETTNIEFKEFFIDKLKCID